jgi:hypothetical protein
LNNGRGNGCPGIINGIVGISKHGMPANFPSNLPAATRAWDRISYTGNGYSRQNTDDHNNNNQLNQGKTFLTLVIFHLLRFCWLWKLFRHYLFSN